MKKIIGLIMLMFIGILNVSAASPVAVDDTATTNEDTSVEIYVISNDTDVDGNTLTVTSLSNVTNGIGLINTAGTGVMFTPSANFNGTGSFDYVVSDGTSSDLGHVVVTVNAMSDVPVAVQDNITLKEDSTKTFDPRVNDTDSNNDTLMIIGKTNGVYGIVSFSDTSLTYKPNVDFYGSDTFTYTISDSKGGTDIGTVKITVTKDSSEDKLVKNVQKEFIMKFKDLKDAYKDDMDDNKSRTEYLKLKNTLRNEYFAMLKDVTGQDETSNANNVRKKYRHLGDLAKLQYSYKFQIKYGNMISSLSDSKLKIVIGRIDNLITKINTGDNNYSTLAQVRLNTMLLALRGLVLENITDVEGIIDIDSLYELFE